MADRLPLPGQARVARLAARVVELEAEVAMWRNLCALLPYTGRTRPAVVRRPRIPTQRELHPAEVLLFDRFPRTRPPTGGRT